MTLQQGRAVRTDEMAKPQCHVTLVFLPPEGGNVEADIRTVKFDSAADVVYTPDGDLTAAQFCCLIQVIAEIERYAYGSIVGQEAS